MTGDTSPVKAPVSAQKASCAPRDIFLENFFSLSKYKNGGQMTISVFLTPERDLATLLNNFSASSGETGFIFQLPIINFFISCIIHYPYFASCQLSMEYPPDGPEVKLVLAKP